MPSAQKPLLPVQSGASPPGPSALARHPASQHTSPAKELLAAIEHGDAGNALRAASTACIRTPLLLLAAVLLILGGAGLMAWLLPQQPLPTMLAHVAKVAHHTQSPRQRAFFEELTQQERHLIGTGFSPLPAQLAARQQQARQPHRTGGGPSLDALALPQPDPAGQPLDQAQQPQRVPPDGQQQQQPLGSTDDGEPMFNIHKLANVPQLFGEAEQQ